MSINAQPPGLRVAIAGLGPKGLFALERLLSDLATAPREANVEVDLFEPHPTPGAGPVYDPAQPEYLRMNLAADGVDLWLHPNACVPVESQLNFVEWRRRTGAGSDHESYPPRAQVGRYLTEGFEQLLACAPEGVRLRLRSASVQALAPDDEGGWRLTAEGTTSRYDEVLLSLGHQASDPASLAADWHHGAPLVPAVYPVESRLTAENIPARSSVAIRGFGLTFLDAALALTEGRGGSFQPDGASKWRFRYVPCGDEPRSIYPYARTGRTMLAKAAPAIAASMPAMEGIAEAARHLVLALPTPASAAELIEIVSSTASSCLLECDNGNTAAQVHSLARAWLKAPPAGSVLGDQGVADELRRSLRVSSGEAPPDLEWALAQAWLIVLPAVVERLGGNAFGRSDWLVFRELARKMERVAFGPPPVNAAKLLALIEAGVIDLRHLSAGMLGEGQAGTELGSPSGGDPLAVDRVVDAVMPAPGVLGAHRKLFDPLIAGGHARVSPARRGIDVADDGSCIGADGRPTPGLATIGRPTEDSVIDNDTLNRSRHPHARLWAERVVARAVDEAALGAMR